MSYIRPNSGLLDYLSNFAKLPDNHAHATLAGRIVGILGNGDPRLAEAALAGGAALCYVVGNFDSPPKRDRVVHIACDPLGAGAPELDVAFFDTLNHPGFDHVQDVERLVAQMRHILRPYGLLYCALKSGVVNQLFDVSNPIVRAGTEALPSHEYLINFLLRQCTVRDLGSTGTDAPREHTRFYRLAIKRPTLLLILGRSHSGKTSLARDLQGFDPQMHVSNDYVYCELVEIQASDRSAGISPRLLAHLGDGSGQACGEFNRALERDEALLIDYVDWIMQMLPRDKSIVSMDIDMTHPPHVEILKKRLQHGGFSVWTVQR